jgi:hypothetical protein
LSKSKELFDGRCQILRNAGIKQRLIREGTQRMDSERRENIIGNWESRNTIEKEGRININPIR